ncbi:hypothetical protein DXE50_06295 [Escherichia coli O145]|nr:hypothetical protein DXE50_06295 [Escherichia coli O145]
MRDFQNAFDAALAGVDSTIVEVMGLCAQFTSGHSVAAKFRGFLTISRLTGRLLFRRWHSVALSMRESILIFTPHAV